MNIDANADFMKNIPAALSWSGGHLRLLDQTKLPGEETYLDIERVEQLEDAILRLCVRGAPAIGCAGAFGTVLAARETYEPINSGEGAVTEASRKDRWMARFHEACEHLAETRPNAN